MAKPGDTGFTSSTGPTKVEPNTKVDYEVNEKGEAHNRTELAALSIGVRCCSVLCGGVAEKLARHSGYAFWDMEHAPNQLQSNHCCPATLLLGTYVSNLCGCCENKTARSETVFYAIDCFFARLFSFS